MLLHKTELVTVNEYHSENGARHKTVTTVTEVRLLCFVVYRHTRTEIVA